MSAEPRRLALARVPTPLETVRGLLDGRPLLVKRDDLTGCALSGNKVRKLEYLLAEAVDQGATRVLTCGGIQSNHCRATAVAAARLGLKSRLFLRTAEPPPPDDPGTGNLRLDRLVGAEIEFITPEQYKQRDALLAAAAEPGDYVIPEGGSNALGAWGYIRAMHEMARQWEQPPTAIVCATGSGGTLAGLILGARRLGLDVPIFGVNVCDDAATFQRRVAEICREAHARWPELHAVEPDRVQLIDGYVGRGYALTTDAEMADIARAARATGLIFDPVYTGKALRPLLYEPERTGERPLFIHTGGIFGLLA